MYDAPHQRVKKVSITLECTLGFHQTQCEALEGACPERMRSFRERSLSALWKAGFGFPDLPCASEAAPLLRAFTQASALEALGFFHLYSFVRSSPCNGQTFIRSNDSLGRPHCTVPPLRAELSL